MTTHAFLSDSWIEATRNLRAEYADQIKPPATAAVKLNLVVQNVPFGPTTLDAHLDTSGGEPQIEIGHLDAPDATVTASYDTVKQILAEGSMSAAMEGIQLGRIRIDGDMFKLMALASINADPGSIALAKAIRAITE